MKKVKMGQWKKFLFRTGMRQPSLAIEQPDGQTAEVNVVRKAAENLPVKPAKKKMKKSKTQKYKASYK